MSHIHRLADARSEAIGHGTRIWQFVVVLEGAQIGVDCNICSHVFIENGVVVGDRVTIKNGVQLWDGLRIEDDVFVGPNVTFTNDRFPRSKAFQAKPLNTVIERGASLGGGSVILPGLTIGRGAMVGAGAVVTRSVPPNAIVVGNPAHIIGYAGARGGDAETEALGAASGPRHSRVKGVTVHQLTKITDIRGSLTVAEFGQAVPFVANRCFMVFDVPSLETRGAHAHRKCHQFLICAHGSCAVVVDDGDAKEEFLLDRPDIGIHIPPMIWGIQYKYSVDAILIVFASHSYDPDDYIRDYDEFSNLLSKPHDAVS
jgi:UDP-2-acetamido-3-amino-2,3-dideoxy-glucuronate N-acetyltransferase